MPTFIVWSCGAVRTARIVRVDVPAESAPFFRLDDGCTVAFPRAELPDVLKTLEACEGHA